VGIDNIDKEVNQAYRIDKLKELLLQTAVSERKIFYLVADMLEMGAACQVVGILLKQKYSIAEIREHVTILRNACEGVFDQLEMTIEDWEAQIRGAESGK